MKRKLLPLILGCLTAGPAAGDTFPPGVIPEPTPDRFSVCQGGGCRGVRELSLSSAEWAAVSAIFQPPSRDPARERLRIAQAVARLERMLGEKTGTAADLGGTFPGLGRAGQMDCIDESMNTTTYLLLLEQAGLIRWHTIEDRITRGFFLFGWPHTTAVIRERSSGSRYVVDSWFGNNGSPPHIIPLKPWRRGWRPLP